MEHKSDTKPALWFRRKAFLIPVVSIVMFGGLALLALIASVKVFDVQPLKVAGTAMQPTLNDGDRIFISKRIGNLRRGDIVVFHHPQVPSKSLIMRIVGLPGEIIRMDELGQLFIDNDTVSEPYLSAARNLYPRRISETSIKPQHYFMMGDNRDASNDSRAWGLVAESNIWGKYIGRYWSSD